MSESSGIVTPGSCSAVLDLTVLDAAATAALVEAAHAELLAAEGRVLVLAAHWADLHGIGRGRARRIGGEGCPFVAEDAAAEWGVLQQLSTGSAWAQLADALDLRHRLPRLWARAVSGRVRVWQAREVAQATRHLGAEAAGRVDAAVAGLVGAMAWARFQRVLQAAIIDADPALAEERAAVWETERFVRASRSENGLATLVARAAAGEVVWLMAMINRVAEILGEDGDQDTVEVRRSKALGILAQPAVAVRLLVEHAEPDTHPDAAHHDEPAETHLSVEQTAPPASLDPARLAPKVVLHVHLSDQALLAGRGVARVEGIGPLTLGQLCRFLGQRATRIRVDPIRDLTELPAVDRYEIPGWLRSAILLQQPVEAFPYGTLESRCADLDHTIPYQAGGPPGQTRRGNLGPLSRSHHRAKTFTPWGMRQPHPGSFVWGSPTGRTFLVTGSGVHPLGTGEFADQIWHAAKPPPSTD